MTTSATVAGWAKGFSEWMKRWGVFATIMLGTVRGVIGDTTAQRIEFAQGHGDGVLDYRRMRRYVVWDVFAALVFGWWWYSVQIPRLFPTYVYCAAAGREIFQPRNVFKAVAVDHGIVTPFFYFPIFYVMKDTLLDAPTRWHTPWKALEHYLEEAFEQVTTLVLYWTPVNIVTFGVVPYQFRVFWTSACCIGNTLVLSYVTARLDRSRNSSEGEDEKAPALENPAQENVAFSVSEPSFRQIPRSYVSLLPSIE